MSALHIGGESSLSWAEAIILVDQALADTATPLFASLANWEYPSPMVNLLTLAATVGPEGHSVLPIPDDAGDLPSDEEVAAVHAQLLEEIHFT